MGTLQGREAFVGPPDGQRPLTYAFGTSLAPRHEGVGQLPSRATAHMVGPAEAPSSVSSRLPPPSASLAAFSQPSGQASRRRALVRRADRLQLEGKRRAGHPETWLPPVRAGACPFRRTRLPAHARTGDTRPRSPTALPVDPVAPPTAGGSPAPTCGARIDCGSPGRTPSPVGPDPLHRASGRSPSPSGDATRISRRFSANPSGRGTRGRPC